MWCPKGYLSFCEIHGALRQLLKTDEGRLKIRESVTEFSHFEESDPATTYRERYDYAEQRVLCDCVDEFFTNCPSLSIVSPAGLCFNIDARIAAYRDIPTLYWQFSFIDKLTGTVSARHFENCFAATRPIIVSMRENIDEIDTDRSASSLYWDLCKIEDDSELWELFKGFDGWAVCCLEEDNPIHPQDFMSLDLTSSAHSEYVRPENLKTEIIRLFDEGKIRNKNSLWKDSFPNETREAFRAAWAEAAMERPLLSKRGPK